MLRRLLSLAEDSLAVDEISGAQGPGNVVTIEIDTGSHTEVFTGFGQIGVRADAVATVTIAKA